MKLNPVILVLIIFISCKEKSNPTIEKGTYPEVAKSKTVEADAVLPKKHFFNEKEFLKLINNTFSDSGEKFVLNNHSINSSILKQNNVLKYILSKEIDIRYYTFKGYKSNIELFIVKNPDNNIDSVYEQIKKLGYSKNRKSDLVPGLSYANDFVFKTNNDIYWLNSPCSISYNNHLKISGILKSLIEVQSKNKHEYFYCKCGKIICE